MNRPAKKPLNEKIYTLSFTVKEKPENYIRHVNNLRYLEWFIDAATQHAETLGWGVQACKERSLAWVVKSHCIEYAKPALQGDQLIIYTWIHSFTRTRVIRRYKCVRKNDKNVICTAETVWVIVDDETGSPKAIPSDFLDRIAIVHQDDEP